MSRHIDIGTEPSELGLRSDSQSTKNDFKRPSSTLAAAAEIISARPVKMAKKTHILHQGLSFVVPESTFKQLNDNLLQLQNVPSGEKYNTPEIRKTFHQMYKHCIKNHLLSKIPVVVSDHLKYIVELLRNFNEYKDVIKSEIIFLYNCSNHSKCLDITGLLQSDYTRYNIEYLGSIKLLALQYILKTPFDEVYIKPLVILFLKDERFLFYGESSKRIKASSIVKVLLHLFSKYADVKVLFGMKILEYTTRFEIPFESLVKQSTSSKFQTSLISSIRSLKPDYQEYVHAFFCKSPLHSCISKTDVYDFSIKSTLFVVNEQWIKKVEKSFNHTDNLKIYQLYYHYTNYLFSFGTPLLLVHRNNLDKILTTINNNLKCFHGNLALLNTVKATLYYIGEYFLDNADFGRVANVINIAFNLYVTYNTDDLLKLATNLQLHVYHKNKTPNVWSKLKKFIKCAFSVEFKIKIFSQIYNIFALLEDSNLSSCCDFVIEGCSELFKLLPGFPLSELKLSSPLMDCLICSQQKGKTQVPPFHTWPILVQMLYQTIDSSTEMSLFDVNTHVSKYDCLYEYEALIKCMYCLYLEMKKRNCVNLKTITQTYITKRLGKNPTEFSVIEASFVETLVLYLNLNSNFSLIDKLSSSLKNIGQNDLILKYAIKSDYNLERRNAVSINSIRFTDVNVNVLQRLKNYENYLQAAKIKGDMGHFETYFWEHIATRDSCVLDVANKTGFSNHEYISVILFNIELYLAIGCIYSTNDNHPESFRNFVKALTLTNSLAKKVHKLDQALRIRLITCILEAFDNIIEECVFMGLATNFEFFVKEYKIISQGITDPVIQFQCFYFEKLFATLTEDPNYEIHSKDVSNFLDLNENLDALGKKCYISKDQNKLQNLYLSSNYFCLEKWLIKSGAYVSNNLSVENLINNNTVVSVDHDKLSMEGLQKLYSRTKNLVVLDHINFMSQIYEKACSFADNNFSTQMTFIKDNKFMSPVCYDALPTDYNIVYMDICYDSQSLLISKVGNKLSRTYSLPLGRNQTIFSTVDALFEELKNIVDLSNGTTAIEVTSCVKTRDDRKKWWETRFSLDERMGSLLDVIENSWLGACKSLLNSTYLDRFLPEYTVLELAMKKYGLETDVNNLLFFMDESDTEDLVRLGILTNKECQLMPNFVAENLDLINSVRKEAVHTVLILAGKEHLIPWESMNIFDNTSVSRMPSLKALQDLLLSTSNLSISKSDISMIVNPNGDLPKTQVRFEHVINKCSHVINNKKPTSEQFISFLKDQSLFVYIGHGSGDQYVKVREIKKSENISPSFLLGCSSASIKPRGKLTSTGTILAYLLGGAPFVVGNLWDVTDKDIDNFSLSMFEKMGISAERQENTTLDVAHAVALSRSTCKLRYLNGAAPVVYGLPLKIYIST